MLRGRQPDPFRPPGANALALRILHVLSQRPGRTGSGVTLDAVVRLAAAAGWQQSALVGVPADEAAPDVGGLPPGAVHRVTFAPAHGPAAPDLPFAVPGMSDVMPYPSAVWSTLTTQQLDLYRAAWRRRLREVLAAERPDLIQTNHVWLVELPPEGPGPGPARGRHLPRHRPAADGAVPRAGGRGDRRLPPPRPLRGAAPGSPRDCWRPAWASSPGAWCWWGPAIATSCSRDRPPGPTGAATSSCTWASPAGPRACPGCWTRSRRWPPPAPGCACTWPAAGPAPRPISCTPAWTPWPHGWCATAPWTRHGWPS